MRSRKLHIILLFLISFFLRSFLFAQKPSGLFFEKVEGEGLTNHYIKCIRQDGNGFLWFGTDEGVFRYDGYSFKAFRTIPGKEHSLINDDIETLYPEKDSALWVGSRGGLSCINLRTLVVANYLAKEPIRVYAIVPENDSVFWIGTSTGLFRFNKKNKEWERIAAIGKNVFIRCIATDDQNNLYIATHDGFYCYHPLTSQCEHYLVPLPNGKNNPSQIVHRIVVDKENNVWMTGWEIGFVRFNSTTKTFKSLFRKEDSLLLKWHIIAFDLLQKEDGSFWIANFDGGLTIFNPANESFANYPVEWDNGKTITDKAYSLFKDRSGIDWLGTENGIYKYDPHIAHLSKIEFKWNKNHKLERTQVAPLCLLKDKDSLWWVGSYEGLFLLHPATGILEDYTSQLHATGVTGINDMQQDDSGAIWLADHDKLVQCFVKKNREISLQSNVFRSPGIQSNIMRIYTDSRNQKWLGTGWNGIFRFDPDSKTFTAYPATSGQQIRCFYEISKDSLLAGGEHTGLGLLHVTSGQYEKINWQYPSPANDITINDICKLDGYLWIATEGNGLLRCDEHFQQQKIYTTEDGLPSMNIIAVMADGRHHLWLLSTGGVVDYSPITHRMIVYDKEDGLRNLEYMWSMMIDKDNNVIIGDMGCLHQYNAEQLQKNTNPPQVFVTAFKIFDKPYAINSSQPVELSYNQNYFSFDFVALNYTHPLLNQYAYQLEGLDHQWNNVGSRRYASYANLKEGRYVFKVKACNNEGVWSRTPASLVIIIKPPFWHRWWFYALVVVVVTAIAYSFYHFKIKQLKIKQQLRNKIARDLHDDIGSTLSGINIFSKMALQKMKKNQSDSTELLQKISDRSEKTMDALSDIVWSINTRNDDIQHFEAKVQEYLSEQLEPLGIAYDFMVAEDMRNIRLDMELRKELYLILKEAVHNICKYAQCNRVQISFTRKKNTGILSIQDNGKGFDVLQSTEGNGLRNIQHRAEKVGAAIAINSQINQGTEISVRFHIT